jgi:hypothetical protein
MTEIEAQTLADDFNLDLGAGTATALYKVFAYWLPNFVKDYNITLVPTIYEAEYNGASESINIGFQRVSIKALALPSASLSDYVTNFQTEGATDAEISAFLGL